MEMTLTRRIFTKAATTGEIQAGAVKRFTVEDHYPTPYVKVPGETCIPEGRYQVTYEKSPRLSKLAGHEVKTLRLHGVPGFEGVLIHAGNGPKDTEGCILPGRKLCVNGVEESRLAVADIEAVVCPVLARGELVFITVKRGN